VTTGILRNPTANMGIPTARANPLAAGAIAGGREPGGLPAGTRPTPMGADVPTAGGAAGQPDPGTAIPITAPSLASAPNTSVRPTAPRARAATPSMVTATATSAVRSKRKPLAAKFHCRGTRRRCSARPRAPRGSRADPWRPATAESHVARLADGTRSRRNSQGAGRGRQGAAAGTVQRAGTTPTGTASRTRITGQSCLLTSRLHLGPLSPQPT
jgi:hypothetical protein